MPATTADIVHPHVRTRELIASPSGMDLLVCQISYGKVPYELVERREATPEIVWLSQDGRAFDTTAWHEGDSAATVYVERWTPLGRAFHGWVDASSRRLVQAG
jgi:hypothetical protein